MKIKKLYEAPQLLSHLVLETLDGRYMMFYTSMLPITEADLAPAPGYHAKGNCAKEAPDYLYRRYGLEKADPNA